MARDEKIFKEGWMTCFNTITKNPEIRFKPDPFDDMRAAVEWWKKHSPTADFQSSEIAGSSKPGTGEVRGEVAGVDISEGDFCPGCKDEWVTRNMKDCPMCGIKLNWVDV